MQPERMRRVGVLMNASEEVAEARANVAALREALQQLGWIAGGNIAFDVRWGGRDGTLTPRHAAELIRHQVDVVVAAGANVVAAIQRASSTIPVVFARPLIRSAPALSTAWRGPEAAQPASRSSSTV